MLLHTVVPSGPKGRRFKSCHLDQNIVQGFLKTLHFFVLFARFFRVCRAWIENWGKIGGRNGFEGAFAPLIFAFGIACAVEKGLYRAGGVFVTAAQRVRVGL